LTQAIRRSPDAWSSGLPEHLQSDDAAHLSSVDGRDLVRGLADGARRHGEEATRGARTATLRLVRAAALWSNLHLR
jgi:hypothetical protein